MIWDGWVGYFVGKNIHLKKLFFVHFNPRSADESYSDVLISFLRGVNCNRSIEKIEFGAFDLLNGSVFTSMDQFFKNNSQLISIRILCCYNFGVEGCRSFALALGSFESLNTLNLQHNDIADEGLVDIITALSMHPYLDKLDLSWNRLSKNGCIALATLLQHTATKLHTLDLSRNEINDEGIDALVPALKNCSLKSLKLSDNQSVTTKGWQQLATILENPKSNLAVLSVVSNNTDDEAIAAFTASLANNNALWSLSMNEISITDKGWRSFSDLLCNTSSVNSTFLSNHTIRNFSKSTSIRTLLELNGSSNDKKEVAIAKILKYHNDFDMQPFFEWEFKVLPLMLSWFERASAIDMPNNFQPNIGRRKLSSIYQFVRGMPVLYVETRLKKELDDIKHEELQFEEEKRRMELLLERKRSIIEKLGLPETSARQ